jgi:hypothetical protein
MSERPGSSPAGSSAHRGRSEETASQLRALADRLEAFALDQLDRLESIAGRCREVLADEESIRAKMHELQHCREAWESGQQSESERLKSEALRLEAAWALLEAEQRRLLMLQGASAALVAASARPVMPVNQPATSGNISNSDSGSPTLTPDNAPADLDAYSHDAALLQFQQLRRDVQRHAHE